MDEEKLQELILLLDQEVPREQARVKLQQYGGGPDEGQIVANKRGFLRFGIEFLKAAYAPVKRRGESDYIHVDLDYLITNDSSINFDWFERRELPLENASTSTRDFVVPFVIMALFIGFLLLSAIGLISVVRWIVAA